MKLSTGYPQVIHNLKCVLYCTFLCTNVVRKNVRIYHFFTFNYLFITYIVTSKPKRISVAAGVVHMIFLLYVYILLFCIHVIVYMFTFCTFLYTK